MRTVTAKVVEREYGARPEGRKGVFLRKKTLGSKFTICAICKRRIFEYQRPSVDLGKGKQAHMECFAKAEKDAGKPN
jgi:hypothetical protein